MTDKAKKIIDNFEKENRLLWGDKFFLKIYDNKVVLMTEGIVKKLKAEIGSENIEITSLDKDESIGSWFRVKTDSTTHIHHYHRDAKETSRLLQNLPSKDMMTVEEEDGRIVTKNELMAGELFRGVVMGDWIASAIYHDFVDIAPKVIGWVRFDEKVEKVDGKEFYRPEKAVPLDEIIQNLIGLPYHLGGKSLKTGFDCSSLVQWVVFHAHGLWLPKIAKWQAMVGEVVDSLDKSQPGDLVFFEDKVSGLVEHVGMVIAGIGIDTKIIHAYAGSRRIEGETLATIISRQGDRGLKLSSTRRLI